MWFKSYGTHAVAVISMLLSSLRRDISTIVRVGIQHLSGFSTNIILPHLIRLRVYAPTSGHIEAIPHLYRLNERPLGPTGLVRPNDFPFHYHNLPLHITKVLIFLAEYISAGKGNTRLKTLKAYGEP
jgi:hypothetical protein